MDEAEPNVEASSRIYVQGLPQYLEDKRLRYIFSERGHVTDSKVIRTRDGRSRQFGFVGFKTVEEAEEAIHYFNNSYIDTSRIHVKFAEKVNSAKLERPWSKYSEGSSLFKKRHKEDDLPEKSKAREAKKQAKAKYQPKDPSEEDPELAEFLEVMQPRKKRALWSNDMQNLTTSVATKPGLMPDTQKQARENMGDGASSEDDEELYQEIAEKPRKRSRAGSGVEAESPEGDSENPGAPEQSDVEIRDKTVTDEGVSDLDYLKSRMKSKSFEEDSDESEQSQEEEASQQSEESGQSDEHEHTLEGRDNTSGEAHETDVKAEDKAETESELQDRKASHLTATTSGQGNDGVPPISETGRLFLRNLPYQASEADLTALFEEYGDLSEVHLVLDKTTKTSTGIALVQFADPESAEAAFAGLDNSTFQGRLLHILPAKPAPKVQTTEMDEGMEDTKEGFKRKKEKEMQAGAGNRAAWNSLFMRQDTVAEAIAAHYGVTKSELLDRDAADLPVRMALGEAHVIAMTKKGLEEQGVDVSRLEKSASASGKAASENPAVDRSSTTLLVKNLPYAATEADLQEKFGRCGPLARLILPETKTIALVAYENAADARQAFKTLAFKRFQSVPLFLEWAPQNIFSSEAPLPKTSGVQRGSGEAAGGKDQLPQAPENPEADEEKDTESSSIYIKNLAWSTDDKKLAKHFDGIVSTAGGSLRAAKVTKRKGPDGKLLSAGYGFVECSSETVAKIALRKLQGSLLEGHKLDLQLSMKKGIATKAGKAKKKEDGKATKLVVRNVAFEATSKDIRALFQPFGQIKSVRNPRKFDGSHRGFAFVDFLTHQEAVNAMEAVAGSHLYGRRLVCEWAAQDEGLNDLRAKTAAKFHGQDEQQAS